MPATKIVRFCDIVLYQEFTYRGEQWVRIPGQRQAMNAAKEIAQFSDNAPVIPGQLPHRSK